MNLDWIVLARFWSKVNVGRADECWLWTGARSRWGYGSFTVNRRHVVAHRLAWELANDQPIPNGLWILHECDTPECVNPAHLYAGTPSDNVNDAYRRNRRGDRTRCSRGHEYTPENTYIPPRGNRVCRKCDLARGRAYYHRRKARGDVHTSQRIDRGPLGSASAVQEATKGPSVAPHSFIEEGGRNDFPEPARPPSGGS